MIDEFLKAIEANDTARVQELIQRDTALARAKGQYGKTGLHLAAEKNHLDIAELLLSAGAEIEAQTDWGMTPLEWAANMGNTDVGNLLLAHGAQMNMWAAAGLGLAEQVKTFFDTPNSLKPNAGQRRHRETQSGVYEPLPPPADFKQIVSDAFYIASRNGHTDLARFLLERGADINFRGFFGAPGLHWAAVNGHAATVQFLIDEGADLQMRDEHFRSGPVSWAEEGRHLEIAELLCRHGACR